MGYTAPRVRVSFLYKAPHTLENLNHIRSIPAMMWSIPVRFENGSFYAQWQSLEHTCT